MEVCLLSAAAAVSAEGDSAVSLIFALAVCEYGLTDEFALKE